MDLGKKGSHFSFSEMRPGKTRESRSLMPECLRYSSTADARGELGERRREVRFERVREREREEERDGGREGGQSERERS